MTGAQRPLIMLTFFPRQIASKAIWIYFISLILVTLAFYRYAMPFGYMCMGTVEVLGFFLLTVGCSQKWSRLSEREFLIRVFWTAFILRAIGAIFFYYFYLNHTGTPFEFDSSDASGYHYEAKWLYEEKDWKYIFYYYFTSRDGISDSGYGLYLTALYKLIGPNIIVARLLKAVYSAITCILIYKLSARTMDEKTGRLAALMCAFMPNFIVYCGLHVKEIEMILLTVAFLERSDYLLRSKNITFFSILWPLLLGASLFFFRTVLGVVAIFSFITALLFSSKKVLSRGRKVIIGTWAIVAIAVLAGGTVMTEIERYLDEGTSNQDAMREQQTSRGNQWAKYATGTVMVPMMFAMPFSTMVDTGQPNQLILFGGNFVRNFMGFFVLLALYFSIFKYKKWRDFSLAFSACLV